MNENKIEVVYWPIAKLRPYVRNPRKNDQAVDRIVASIREFGFAVPVLAKSDGEIVDGHLRVKGAIRLMLTELPVIVCDAWTDAQVKAFRLMANRSVMWASWDMDGLVAEFGDLKAAGFDLSLTGFDAVEYGDMSSIEFKEFDETAADDVKYIDCPACGHHFLK